MRAADRDRDPIDGGGGPYDRNSQLGLRFRDAALIIALGFTLLRAGELGADGGASPRELEQGASLGAPSPSTHQVLLLEPRRDPRIDPIVASFIDSRLRFLLADAQWAPLDAAEARATLRSNRMSENADFAQFRDVIVREQLALALLPIVYAAEGRYIVELWILRADAPGIVAAQVAAEANELGPAIDALLYAKLPRIADFDRAAAREAWLRADEDERRLAEAFSNARAREPSPKRTHWAALALASGSAIGPQLAGEGFYIHTLRTRLELRPRDRLGIGIILGYANLPGRNGREHNLPLLGELNYRVPIAGIRQLSLPIRFAVGYMPFNGPIIRTSVGVNIELTPEWELGADLISPAAFRSPERFHFAFDLSLEATRRFGRLAP